ncbi:hypothetical protein ACP70R_028898 [Stipagrostis hirtigluma subsp. patula]
MSPPSGGEAPLPTPRRPASTGGSGEAAAPPCLLKRKDPAGVEDEAAPARNVRSKSPPPSPLHEPQVQAGVSAPQHGADSGEEDTSDDASASELGEKLLPRLPKRVAAATWARFVNNAEICLKHYNSKHQSNFVYKHAPGNGYCRVQEQDSSCYYHMNFDAQDKSGHSQLFFGEIKVRVDPKEEVLEIKIREV